MKNNAVEFKEIKSVFPRYSKSFYFSEKYAVFCTGKTAIICDKKMNVIQKIEKLDYVYSALASPDEKYLLLISNSNKFYVVNMNDFSVTKQIVRGKYDYNLEGRGCWSFDGNRIYIPVYNVDSGTSALRCYDHLQNFSSIDLLEEKYWLHSITPVINLKKYLLMGTQRRNFDGDDPLSMIWFDGNSFEQYPIDIKVYNDIARKTEYDTATDTVILYGLNKTVRFDIYGKYIEEIPVPEEGKRTFSFSDVFKNVLSDNDLKSITDLSNSYGMENVTVNDRINKICLSSDEKTLYVGTHMGLFAIDAKTQEIIAKKPIDDIQDIKELYPGSIVVSTYSTVKLFQLV